MEDTERRKDRRIPEILNGKRAREQRIEYSDSFGPVARAAELHQLQPLAGWRHVCGHKASPNSPPLALERRLAPGKFAGASNDGVQEIQIVKKKTKNKSELKEKGRSTLERAKNLRIYENMNTTCCTAMFVLASAAALGNHHRNIAVYILQLLWKKKVFKVEDRKVLCLARMVKRILPDPILQLVRFRSSEPSSTRYPLTRYLHFQSSQSRAGACRPIAIPEPTLAMALRSFSTPAAVGTAVRLLHPKTTASLSLLATRTDSCDERKNLTGRLCTSANLCSWRSSANYVRTLEGTTGFLSKASIFRCATIEEIEAEKHLIEKDARERMEKTIETVRSNFNAVRTGRANPAMLDGIEVEYYGSPVTLKSIAQISTPDASSLLVQPFDKSSLKVIEKAIVSSDLGLTPNNDGEAIRLGIPQLTSERRKEFLKRVAKQAEEGKVAIRNIRRDAIKAYEKLEKEKKLSEDNVKDLSSDLQKVTDEYMKKLDSLLKQKEKIHTDIHNFAYYFLWSRHKVHEIIIIFQTKEKKNNFNKFCDFSYFFFFLFHFKLTTEKKKVI
ncbi:hypothetical protein IEQ34_002463 [Dendrobium chrysotoxum]|uniref:Ribosome-recycling factor, chloroplastic n=1 Tax=Dendrobium chrysotoxum TaxID=161865 RepID=A0AAV7HJH2_DENCH|nr:hypothetical protein IEQ34_002463 [Dendrobium chrysotoxum]